MDTNHDTPIEPSLVKSQSIEPSLVKSQSIEPSLVKSKSNNDVPIHPTADGDDQQDPPRRRKKHKQPDSTSSLAAEITNRPVIINNVPRRNLAVRRDGQSYVLQHEWSISDEDTSVTSMINNLHSKSMKMSSSASKTANVYKIIYVICTIIIIIAGAVIGVLGLKSCDNAASYVATGLGFLVTAIQSFITTFNIEKRSVLLKESSYKLRTISRNVGQLRYSNESSAAVLKMIESHFADIDDIGLNMFNTTPIERHPPKDAVIDMKGVSV